MTTDYAPLWKWVREREAIRVRRECGDPFPWTDDPIFRDYRFCNVRREDDSVTDWIRENIREPFADHPNLWFMLCIARMINWPDTLGPIISSGNYAWPVDEHFKPSILGDVLDGLANHGQKVFTGAYIIPTLKGVRKTRSVPEHNLGALWNDRRKIASVFDKDATLRRTHAVLMRYDGWGQFLSYQAVVDMRFTQLLFDAPDRTQWAAAGPGTVRGLNRIHGRPTDGALSQDRALAEMREIYRLANDATGVVMDFSDVPNILCETDKYLRVERGEGTPRARYVPGRGS